MTIRIQCFASLREQLGVAAAQTPHRHGMTVADIWHTLTQEAPPPNLLCACNHDYVGLDHTVADGDEVAFFPPVTGG